MKKIKRLKYKRFASPRVRLPTAGIGRRAADAALNESLEGAVQGMTASAGEERAARALSRLDRVQEYFFRVPVGGARNTPGWKELDFLVSSRSGLYYLVEVDSVFTHMQKANADILHDAILLEELKYLPIYPKVFHVDNDRDLSDQSAADETFRRLIT